jgi:hypothetical protein
VPQIVAALSRSRNPAPGAAPSVLLLPRHSLLGIPPLAERKHRPTKTNREKLK